MNRITTRTQLEQSIQAAARGRARAPKQRGLPIIIGLVLK